MARPKLFDPDQALDAAVSVFREHGYAGTSAERLTSAMQIGKQSLYDTFGGKWPLYCAALQRYSASEIGAHIAMMNSDTSALAGMERMLKRVVSEARTPCLGVGSIAEFGSEGEGTDELNRIRDAAGSTLRKALVARVREGQEAGEIAAGLDANHAAGFLLANIGAIRLAGRGGASDAELRALAKFSLQALK